MTEPKPLAEFPATLENCVDFMVGLNANDQGWEYYNLKSRLQAAEKLCEEYYYLLEAVLYTEWVIEGGGPASLEKDIAKQIKTSLDKYQQQENKHGN